ncbi:MAG: competence/damage-inducible protein A [Bacillota bacterium]|jgi:nicotinamide-nucleotide amidase
MIAEIIAVGTELLLGQIVNTNAQFLSQELAALGISVYFQTVVGDNPARLGQTLRQALGRSDLVILTGGLGPTRDDLTRETVADVLGRPLTFQEDLWEAIRARMLHSGQIPENNKRQAWVPEGAVPLHNPNGTAPGLVIREGEQLVALLPGPPREMQPMFTNELRPLLLEMIGQGVIYSRSLHVIGIGESRLEEQIADLIEQQTNPTLALYAHNGEVEIRITAQAEDDCAAQAAIAPLQAEIEHRLGDAVFGYDRTTLPEVLGELLRRQRRTITVAESCTGGLISSAITSVPGSSDYYERGFVTYSNQAKADLLGVSPETLARHGAVSEECAREMARGARSAAGADIAVAVTGIAGPSGGTPEKPVGTVYIAIVGPAGEQVHRLALRGDRQRIQERTAKSALNLTRLYLAKGEDV